MEKVFSIGKSLKYSKKKSELSFVEIEKKSDEYIKDLLRNVHGIDEIIVQLSNQSTLLREISVNAAIASGHVESQSKIFNEIAKQIGSISYLLSEVVSRSEKVMAKISTEALTCIVNHNIKEKFSYALNTIHNPKNIESIHDVCSKLQDTLHNRLQDIQFNLHCIRPEQETLKRVVHRISNIVLNLKVLANTAQQGEEPFLLSIAESLEKSAEKTTEQGQQLLIHILRIENSLQREFNEIQNQEECLNDVA